MYDKYNRRINYLRISVTDRCNLRCTYCMPEEGIKIIRHEDILSLEEMAGVARIAAGMGVEKIRITGGEPLVRKGVVQLVKMISEIPGIRDLALTTNGQLLESYAQPLAEAGLKRINISLDTVDPDRYREITRGGDIRNVIKGIVASQKAGLHPVKLNCVVDNSSNEADAVGVRDFAARTGVEVRFIMLTSDGKIKPCLFDNVEFDVRKLGAEEAIRLAIEQKPECGHTNSNNLFHNIGG
jgi:GTP 3',8-cyclase